jgi:hypothetical protein
MILIVIFCLLAQSLVVVQRLAKADKISGRVEVQRHARGEFSALTEAGVIQTCDVVRTGADGIAEFKWTDGTRWKVMPNTQITVKKATYNMVKKSDQRQLDLSAGKVFIRIMKSLAPSSKFEVETPTAVAAVRGTIFSVEVVNGKTEVAVFKGQVKVTTGDDANKDETMITPGQSAVSGGAGELQTVADAKSESAFSEQATIVTPELMATVKRSQEGCKATINGMTEVGDTVTINGERARVLGNGSFIKRLPISSGTNTFTIVSTDKHGEKTTLVRTLTAGADCGVASSTKGPAANAPATMTKPAGSTMPSKVIVQCGPAPAG